MPRPPRPPPPSLSATEWIERLGLRAHPEGGWYAEVYRAELGVTPARRDGPVRAACTSIFFLLTEQNPSRLHRIRSDELWHFHAGGPVTVHQLCAEAGYEALTLGPDPRAGQALQGVVPAGRWFGATTAPGAGYALVSCTVAPGFDFADFELAERGALLQRFPEHAALVRQLTPEA
ncbi:MAG: cupin domain-containing protein [Alphaproteobacteria bacterium]|nr:cupin domain-containing protein [Alphaproteobacteria bacterium]